MAKVTWRGITTDAVTAKMLGEAARIVGDDIYLRPIQGSYTSSNENSGGTHDGGGVVDIGCSNLTSEQAKRVETTLRKVGCAAWWRPATSYWASHVHAVRQDCRDLSSAARTQVGDYRAGFNGIPIGGRTTRDTGTRAYVDVTWGAYVPEEDIMATRDEMRADMRAIVRDELRDYGFLREVARFVLTGYGFDHDRNADTPDAVLSHAQRETYLMAASAVAQTAAARTAIEAELEALRAEVDALDPKADTPAPVAAFGVDVSRHQTAEQVTAAVAGEGYEFCIINATTGLRSVSSALATNTQIARASGDLVGFYHWSQTVNDLATTPDKSDPIGEAMHYLAKSGVKTGDLVALDHEEALGTWGQRVRYAEAWMGYVAGQSGASPLLYINGDWLANMWRVATEEQRAQLFANVWYARPTGTPGFYGDNPLYDPASYPGVNVVVHQFSTTDNLDRNWTPDLAALKALGVRA